ncbi:MAG: FkbM family methyltransferase, partial [Microgenomates group bacterium]
NKNDLFVGKSLDLYGEWSQAEFDLLGKFIKPGDVIFDIGAYIGTHSVFFGKKVSPGGFVVAIEPQRIAFEILNTNLVLNELINVFPVYKFASDIRQKIAVPLLNPYVKQNFGALRISRFKEGEIVESVLLDDFNLPKCNIIKIDTEENEDKIIKGAAKTIKKYKPIIYVENNEVQDSQIIIKAIRDIGYFPYWHIFPYFNPNNFFKNKKNVFAKFDPEANMICFPQKPKKNYQGLIEVSGSKDNWREALKRMYLPNKRQQL